MNFQKSMPEDPLTVITTHTNADFDALASLLAAQKLYPGSMVVFPGSQEKNLRNFFVDSMVYLLNMADIREIDLEQVRRLVLVDTRQPGRIGKLAELVNRPGVVIHIYDHHPEMPQDIQGSLEVIEPVGATVSLLTEIITRKNIPISADEATVMCLGIYEDTGSFTFASTTERDFQAAAILLSKGANLNVIANLIAREMSPEQVSILNDMIQNATRYDVNGIEVVVTTVVLDFYSPDYAFLVHKMVKMEDLSVIFALAAMGNKVYLVARSRLPEVDVGAIVTPLGGGGHTFAASATIKDKTLTQVEHQLVHRFYAEIRSRRQARHLMSAPAIRVDVGVSCRQAEAMLTRYSVNALLVTEGGGENTTLVGYISRQIVEKALFHKLDAVPVREYMNTEMAAVAPDADLFEIQEKIIGNKQRILPVVDGTQILGVITRTDLLALLVRTPSLGAAGTPDPLRETVQARTRHALKFMKERLSTKIIDTLQRIGQVAAELGYNAYVVGGFVRDLYLYRQNEDVDIVIEGDGIGFAKSFAALSGARIHAYAKFNTAVIIFPDGFKIDVASARMEYYPFPAALPMVEMSSIKLDMFRRDFTVNTLAISLAPGRFGTLIDFYNALKDLKEKAIRVLHNLSFVEDPTRVFRAIRFEQRFGFSIGKLTAGLIRNAVKMDFFKRLSGRRVFSELRLIFQEENPTPAMIRLNDFNLVAVIHPSIELTESLITLFNSTKKVLDWYDLLFLEESYMRWAVYLLVLLHSSDTVTSEEICRRFELAPRHRGLFCRDRLEAQRCLYWLERHLPLENSTLYRRLTGFKTELILYMMAATENEVVKRAISHYFTRLRYTRISIQGKDLKQMGLVPGPLYRKILDAVLDARLNGWLKNRADELAFVKRYAA